MKNNQSAVDSETKTKVIFSWDYELIQEHTPRQTIECSHTEEVEAAMLEGESLHEYMQDNGLDEAREVVKEFAQMMGYSFFEPENLDLLAAYEEALLEEEEYF